MARRLHRARSGGFSLVELAVVMAIVALVLGGAMFTLSAQVETRNFNEAQLRIEQAKELLLAYAVVNKRLPCPARYVSDADNSQGQESFCSAEKPAACGTPTTTFQTHSRCSESTGGAGTYSGFLPGRAIGFQPVDTAGYALDPWGNRIRYAVDAAEQGVSPNVFRFTRAHTAGGAAWSLLYTPTELLVCSSAASSSTACDPNASIVNVNTVAAIVFSTGKNGPSGGTGTNESRNLDGNALFVSRPPDPSGATNGEFDDQMVWIPANLLYSRMIAAGILP